MRWKEYRTARLSADLIVPSFSTDGMEGTRYIFIRTMFGNHRLSRWVLRDWLKKMDFHYGGTIPLVATLHSVPGWARERGVGPWLAYTEHDEETGIFHLSRFYFQRENDAAAFADWLSRNISDEPSTHGV